MVCQRDPFEKASLATKSNQSIQFDGPSLRLDRKSDAHPGGAVPHRRRRERLKGNQDEALGYYSGLQ